MFPDISRDDIFRLETERLWLRWLRAADAPAIAAFAGLADVARMTASMPHPYPPGEAERFILHARASTAGGNALVLAATTKAKGRPVAGLVSAQVEEPGEVEFGYTIGPAYAGRGFATEMVRRDDRCRLQPDRGARPRRQQPHDQPGFAARAGEVWLCLYRHGPEGSAGARRQAPMRLLPA